MGRLLKDGEAVVWNLGWAGWAVRTRTRVLVFDYHDYGEQPETPGLANGHIDPGEIRGLPVVVFSSHNHVNHLDKVIMAWEKSVPRVTYVFGFQAFQEPRHHHFLDDRQARIIDGIDIAAVRDGSGSEAGVGFLVKADGLTIYHGGDYKGRRALEPESLEYLAGRQSRVDLAFLRLDDISRRASTYALKCLKPTVAFPMHAINQEHLFERQAREYAAEAPAARFVCSVNRGDRYIYRDGGIDTGGQAARLSGLQAVGVA